MSLVVSFYAVFFPRDVLDEIWDLIEPVSEGFPTYSREPINTIYELHGQILETVIRAKYLWLI